MAERPEVSILARDRGGGYGAAAPKAEPHVLQVADRWHLMENASAAFLIAVRKLMRAIRCALGTTRIDPDLLTRAERLQYEGYVRREEANAAIMGLFREGLAIKEIVRRTGHSRGLIRQVLRGQRTDVFMIRKNTLDVRLPFLDKQMGRWLPQRCRTLATPEGARLPLLPAGGQRMGEARQRPGGKLGLIVDRLAASAGATADEVAETTGWQSHTVLGALSRLRARGLPCCRGPLCRGMAIRLPPSI